MAGKVVGIFIAGEKERFPFQLIRLRQSHIEASSATAITQIQAHSLEQSLSVLDGR